MLPFSEGHLGGKGRAGWGEPEQEAPREGRGLALRVESPPAQGAGFLALPVL